jgi:hypothetical protein
MLVLNVRKKREREKIIKSDDGERRMERKINSPLHTHIEETQRSRFIVSLFSPVNADKQF